MQHKPNFQEKEGKFRNTCRKKAAGQQIKTRSGRAVKKPSETYKQDCVLTATKVKSCRDKKKTKAQNNARVKRFRDKTMS